MAAAREFYEALAKKYPPLTRLESAQIRRRPGRSRYIGVRKVVAKRGKAKWSYWTAAWSPEPGLVRTRQFSIRKHGAKQALALALKARRKGLNTLRDIPLKGTNKRGTVVRSKKSK